MSTDVTLSAPSAGDASEFIAAARASTTLQRPWVSAPDTPERFAAFLIRAAREDQASYLIRHRQCGGLVGYVNINNIVRGVVPLGPPRLRRLRLACRPRPDVRGSRGRRQRCLHRPGPASPRGEHPADNAPSLALVRRLGFRREGFSPHYLMVDGQWRDHERWTMLAEDWAADS